MDMPALARNVAEAERAARLNADAADHSHEKETDAAGVVMVERWRARVLTDASEAALFTHAMVVHAADTYVEVKAAEGSGRLFTLSVPSVLVRAWSVLGVDSKPTAQKCTRERLFSRLTVSPPCKS